MEKNNSVTSIELLTHGKRKTIPIVLDSLTILGFLSFFTLMILQKDNIEINHFFQVIVNTLLVIGIISFMISCYSILNWDINQLRQITGKIKLTQNNIEINKSSINIEDVDKIYFKANSTKGFNRLSDGTNNKIEIKTSTNNFTQKFIIETREKRGCLKNYALYLKTKKIKVIIEGIDLK